MTDQNQQEVKEILRDWVKGGDINDKEWEKIFQVQEGADTNGAKEYEETDPGNDGVDFSFWVAPWGICKSVVDFGHYGYFVAGKQLVLDTIKRQAVPDWAAFYVVGDNTEARIARCAVSIGGDGRARIRAMLDDASYIRKVYTVPAGYIPADVDFRKFK